MNSFTSISDLTASRRFAIRLLLIWLFLLLLPAVLVIVVDPYQVFHRSWLPQVFFYKDNERYQVAGLVKHYLGHDSDYDSAVIGSSLSANITSEEVQATLGWKALNLSIRAGSLAERALVLQQALASGNIKHVLLELNPADTGDVEALGNTFPAYLYTNQWFDKYQYVFNQTLVLSSLALLEKNGWLNNFPEIVRKQFLLDPLKWSAEDVGSWNRWIQDAELNDAFNVYNNLANLSNKKQELNTIRQQQGREGWIWRTDYSFAEQKAVMLDSIRKHPEVEFRIWFAAASLWRYAADFNMDAINKHVELRRFVVSDLASLPNVRIYGFDNELSITAELHNYMDPTHFTRQIQSRILNEIANNNHRITLDNIDAYTVSFRDNILHFDVNIPDIDTQSQNVK